MESVLEHPLAAPVIIMIVILAVFPLAVGYIVLAERKVLADMQARLGPMRVGPHGFLQPIADALKLLLKEDTVPEAADKTIFVLAPVISFFTALTAFTVLPFSQTVRITDVNVGLLIVSAMSAVGILGIILGGWSSNSHYPLLGALRSAAQLVSYEVALGIALVTGVMAAGTLSMVGMVEAQRQRQIWLAFDNYGLMFIPLVIYFIAAVAETNRAPFDLPEAESELVAGFHTEYSGFRWGVYMLSEYGNILVVSGVAVTLFLGGWLRPFPNVAWLDAPLNYGTPLLVFAGTGLGSLYLVRRLKSQFDRIVLVAVGIVFLLVGATFVIPAVNAAAIGVFWFLLKIAFFMYVLIWFRGTFPRFRYDQLMDIGWKRLIPVGLAMLMVNAAVGMWKGL